MENLSEKERREGLERFMFYVFAGENENRAYLNGTMDKETLETSINICIKYELVRFFNELGNTYPKLMKEITEDIIKDIDFSIPIPNEIMENMDKWFTETFKN